MRIAQLANFVGPSSGGMKTAVEALGAGYAAAGHQRLLVVPGPCDAERVTEAGEVVQVSSPQVGGGYRLIVQPWRVLEILDRWRPTSLEVSDKSTLLPVTGWARRRGLPALLFSHERLDAMVALRTRLAAGTTTPVAALNRILVRRFDGVVVTSGFAQQEFAAVARTAGTPLHRVPLGVDLEAFRPPARPQPRDDVLRLVHVGRLSREKSPHLAVATAAALHRRGVKVRLDVYGDGPHRAELRELAGDTPLVLHGHLAGRRELSEAVGNADVALSVCPGETFGLAVLEALASGTPVVTADTGGARELVDSDSGAWAPADPEALADAVLRVAHRPETTVRLAARRRAELFPWSRTVAAMLDVHTAHTRCRPEELATPA